MRAEPFIFEVMNAERKRQPLQIVGFALLAAGVAIAAVSAYNLTLGDQIAGDRLQQAAEVEPLVVASNSAESSQLEIGDIFAKLYVPRFGDEYVRNIAEGTSLTKVLNTVGIGHYVGTAMPGEVGNFAIAGHRAGNGGPMRLIDKFQTGDLVFVETSSTRFTYRYLESKIVSPEEVGVIALSPLD